MITDYKFWVCFSISFILLLYVYDFKGFLKNVHKWCYYGDPYGDLEFCVVWDVLTFCATLVIFIGLWYMLHYLGFLIFLFCVLVIWMDSRRSDYDERYY